MVELTWETSIHIVVHDAYKRNHLRGEDRRIPCPKCGCMIEPFDMRCIDPQCPVEIIHGCGDSNCCLQKCDSWGCTALATHIFYNNSVSEVMRKSCEFHIGTHLQRISYMNRKDGIATTCGGCSEWGRCFGWDIDGCNNDRLEMMAEGVA